jgi:hypothetical protein
MIKTAILTNQNSRSLPYPKLMIAESGTIVLFQDRATGVVIIQGNLSLYKIGHYRNTWDFNAFSDYYEAITLQNELP